MSSLFRVGVLWRRETHRRNGSSEMKMYTRWDPNNSFMLSQYCHLWVRRQTFRLRNKNAQQDSMCNGINLLLSMEPMSDQRRYTRGDPSNILGLSYHTRKWLGTRMPVVLRKQMLRRRQRQPGQRRHPHPHHHNNETGWVIPIFPWLSLRSRLGIFHQAKCDQE